MAPSTRSILFTSLLTIPSLILAQKTAFLEDFAILDEKDERKPPFAASTVNKWDAGSYPQFCYDTANAAKGTDDPRRNCEIANVEVFDVAYADCPDKPWTVCRCTDAQLSVDQMVNAFGRVPPGVRSHVVHIFILDGSRPDGSIGKSGGSNNDRFVIRGPIDDAAFAHESFHSVDKGFSSQSTFTDAYDADSCVPDNYANSSPAEDFAQLGTWLDYDINGVPISSYLDKDQGCMKNQLEAVRAYATQYIDLNTSECFDRRPNDGNVTPAASTGVKALDVDDGPAPPITFEFEDEW
ncbi:hypothetical protein BU26DRAFT_516626 [Trematosphaeria pertusa]|uniref:Uncharacterized protein n=1 Tax=Trematosphaeria pertusa TaxID=390896 RepID=A0A6A6IP79_9PLEO|nr:uncharacterized protein BU26DRAFT_516626 [Trematosphaeria pertusa]KAF2251888.1 hypothetical protein BU26DRAFT_516626 [Trematosphaeria pertusa]